MNGVRPIDPERVIDAAVAVDSISVYDRRRTNPDDHCFYDHAHAAAGDGPR